MKLKISSVFLFAAIVALSAFKNPTKPVTYKVDASKSTITWIGKKLTGSHNGTIALKSGTLNINGKKIIGGGFIIDMTTIKEIEGNTKLEMHLKSEDFFSVVKFPASNFVITGVSGSGSSVIVSGNLTIKGITKPLSFPATVLMGVDGTVTAVAARILVDRAKYDVKYGSKSFFDTIGDKAIDDEFELSVKLIAVK